MHPDSTALDDATLPPMPGYSSFLTLLAFYIFTKEGVDIGILETGMGGETDSTNVVQGPIATGITEHGLDHVKKLGGSIESIAWHKSGIFKPGVPAFSVPQSKIASSQLQERASERRTAVQFVNEDLLNSYSINVAPNTAFQRLNAALALSLDNSYVAQMTPPGRITPDIARCVEFTDLPAKFEIVSQGKFCWILSSAHNDMSVDAACHAFLGFLRLSSEGEYRTVLIFSRDSYRDSDKLLRSIFSIICINGKRPFHQAIFCSDILDQSAHKIPDFHDNRILPGKLAESCQRHISTWATLDHREAAATAPNVNDAMDSVRADGVETCVFVVGSVYAAGIAHYTLLSNGKKLS